MAELSNEQQELKASIQKSAIIWGLVLGLLVGLIAYWLLGDQENIVRIGGTAILGVGVVIVTFRSKFRTGAKLARCAECGATFSISRSNREEILISSEEKSQYEKLDSGGSKLTEWVEEKYDVLETYACSKCGNESIKEFQTTRRKDQTTREKSSKSNSHPADDVALANKSAMASDKSSPNKSAPRKSASGKSATVKTKNKS